MHEVNLFVITFFAALVGVIPPGLVNMAVAKTCVDINRKAGKYKAFGAASVVFIQALVAIFIAKEILKSPDFKDNILIFGIIVLAVMMVYFLIAATRQKATSLEPKTANVTQSFLKGVLYLV